MYYSKFDVLEIFYLVLFRVIGNFIKGLILEYFLYLNVIYEYYVFIDFI